MKTKLKSRVTVGSSSSIMDAHYSEHIAIDGVVVDDMPCTTRAHKSFWKSMPDHILDAVRDECRKQSDAIKAGIEERKRERKLAKEAWIKLHTCESCGHCPESEVD